MRIAICDDDILMLEQLQRYIKTYFEKNRVKCPEILCFSNGESLLGDKREKDILFLDIEMPGINGIYVGNELKRENENIIIFIVTSYPEYLDDAMRFHVFRYLSKPLDMQRFFRNMKDAINLYNTMTVKLPVETKQGVHTLAASSIIVVEALGRKVIVHSTVRDFDSVHNMQYWLESLPKNCFFQTHRSFIVEAIILWQYTSTLFIPKHEVRARLTLLCILYFILFVISLYDFKWLNALLYFLVNYIFLIIGYRLKWYSVFFHSAVLIAVMAMCELTVYSIIGHFAPHFFTKTTSIHNIIIFAIFSKMIFFTTIYILIHFLKERQEYNQKHDKYTLLLVFIPLTSVFVMLTFVAINDAYTLSPTLIFMITLSAVFLLITNLFVFGINQYNQKRI